MCRSGTRILSVEKFVRALLRKLGLIHLARRVWSTIASRRRGIRLTFEGDRIRVRRGREEIHLAPAHEVYTYDMVVFFDYYFSAVTPEERNGTRVADYSRPKVHRLRRSLVELEFPSLPESDESTEMYLGALQPKEGEVVLDLGAYAGGSTYFFSKAVGPNGCVLAFEPDITSLQFLRANIARHALANVEVFDCGVWSENTTLAFQAEGSMGSSVSALLKRDSNLRETRVITLSEAAKLANGRRIDCIKMDIEGAEVEVLKSAGSFFREHRPRLVIEPHKLDGRMSTDDVSRILQGYGYEVEVLSQGSQEWPLVRAWPL